MARPNNKLSARQVESLNKVGRHSDGGSLYLNITKDYTKSWVFIYTRNNRKREIGLGAYAKPIILRNTAKAIEGNPKTRRKTGKSLEEARIAAGLYRAVLADGGDPFEFRKNARKEKQEAENALVPFGQIIEQYIEERVEYRENAAKNEFTGFSNEKHRYQWRMTLRVYALALHDIPASQITMRDVLRVLEPMWVTKNETAKRTRQRIEKVWGYAKAQGLCEGENPARWKDNLDGMLSDKTPKKLYGHKTHLPSMPYQEVPSFMVALRAREALTARLLEFIILTAARSKEARHAQFSEFDLEKKIWTVPARRMKNKIEHVVPLSVRAVEIISQMATLSSSEYVFCNPVFKKPYSDNAPRALLKRMEITGATCHGFRTSFRGWADESTYFQFGVKEAALSHKYLTDTQAAYSRSNLLEKRRSLMDKWADFTFAACST